MRRAGAERCGQPASRVVLSFVLAAVAGGIAVAAATAVPRQQSPVPVLVSTEWLAAHLGDPELVLLHVAMVHDGAPPEVISGAGLLDYHALAARNRDGLIIEMQPVKEMVAALQRAGVSNDSHVILYGSPGHAPARGFVTLEFLGHERVSVLDGGLEVWKQEGRPTAGAAVVRAAGDFEARLRSDVLVTADWVNARLGDPSVTLIDARPRGEFTGERGGANRRGGHIPGAANLYWEDLLESDSVPRLQPVGDARRRFEAAGVTAGGTVVSYCYIGMRASYTYLISRHLGYEARFYDGSWDEWSQRPDLPAERGSGT